MAPCTSLPFYATLQRVAQMKPKIPRNWRKAVTYAEKALKSRKEALAADWAVRVSKQKLERAHCTAWGYYDAPKIYFELAIFYNKTPMLMKLHSTAGIWWFYRAEI